MLCPLHFVRNSYIQPVLNPQLTYTEWATIKLLAFRFARALVIFSLALVCILCRVFEQLVNSRAVNMLRYTRCNIVILMVATVWLMLSFISCIVCGFDSYTVLFKCPQRNFFWRHLKSTVYESNPHTIQELKDNISHTAAAIKITMLHRVYLNMIRHWRIGRKSKLTTENKLLMYKAILKPIWSYGVQLWGCAKPSNTKEYNQKY